MKDYIFFLLFCVLADLGRKDREKAKLNIDCNRDSSQDPEL